MATGVFTVLLSNVTSLALEEANRVANVKEPIESLAKELLLMNASFQSLESIAELDESAAKWLEETHVVVCRAEDLISQYKKRLAKRKWAAILNLSYLKERYKMAVELERVTVEIHKSSEKGKDIIWKRKFGLKNLNMPFSPEAGNSTFVSAMTKLDDVLIQNRLLPQKLFERLKNIRDEMGPLGMFLSEVEPEADLDERQKVWVQEIKDIFQLLEEALLSIQPSREEEIKYSKSFRSLMLALHGQSHMKLGKKIQKIEKRLAGATSGYHSYAIGEFKLRSGQRSMVLEMRSLMSTKPAESRFSIADLFIIRGPITLAMISIELMTGGFLSMFARLSELLKAAMGAAIEHVGELPSWFVLQPLMLDIKLMKALFEDVSGMGDSDCRRMEVWLEQMREIYSRLKDLDNYAKEVSEARYGVCKIHSLGKIVRKAKQIEKEIHDISARKMRYDIGSFVAEKGNHEILSLTEVGPGQSNSSSKLEVQIELMKELHLINALLEDISTMEKLDARLKVWLEEILGAAREANAIVERDFRGLSGRIKVSRRMNEIYKWIDDISEWKKIYDIRTIKARNRAISSSHDLKAAEAYPTGTVKAEFESIRRELKLMKALDADIQEIFGLDGKVEVWMEEMRDVAEEAEELIRNYDDTASKRGIPYILKLRYLQHNLIIQNEVLQSIRQFKDKIQKLYKKRIRYGIEQINRVPPNIYGEITAKLLLDNEHLCVLPILHLERTGKASLSESIKNNNALLAHFDWHVWVTVPENFNAVKFLKDVLEQIKEQEEKKGENNIIEPLVPRTRARQKEIWTEEEEMMQKLEGILIQKRYLIVMDGIQSVEDWHYFYKAFPDASNGSRIILATQNMAEDKWRLLCHNLVSDMQTDKRMDLARQSKFQLLAPVKLGELQPENETVSDWEMSLLQLNEEETSRPESSTVSHENAPSYLWRCLFYFLLFPAGMEIPARRLTALWVAEGLVRPKRGENKPAEYFCELYLSELIRRRMIKATKRKLNGKVKACQLCDNMQETLLKKAEEANFFQDESAMTFRLVVHYANRNTSYGHIDGSNPCPSSSLKAHYKKVISFFSFDTEEGGKHGDDIGNFLHRCISNRCFLSLRVLDLERVFKPKLPPALGILTGLRYLGLRWTYLEYLPDHVSKLLNLQVLDVKRTYISTLPESIWSMQYLRHLYLSETYHSRFVNRPRNRSLTDLQTLWGAFIDEDSPVLNGLDTIRNVRKLGLTCKSMSSADMMISQLDAVGDWIQKLKHLEHLRLKSFGDLGNLSDLHLKPLSGHNNLSTVYLVGRLRYPSIVSEFPVNVTDITLSGSELEKDPMIALQSLKKLIILRLFSRSTTCRTMRCTKGGFPQLRVLKIWNLEHLEKWELEKGALPSLKDLEIRNCQNLIMIPYGLTDVETLRELKLSDEFAQRIKDNEPIVWDKIEHLLKVDRE